MSWSFPCGEWSVYICYTAAAKTGYQFLNITNCRITQLMLCSIPYGNLMALVRTYQKTKGLSFSEEKNTIRFRPERNLSDFFSKKSLKITLTWLHKSVKSTWGRMKDCRLTIKCLSTEKT